MRADYLLGGEFSSVMKNVELNTIAAGMGVLTDLLWQMQASLYGIDKAGEKAETLQLCLESLGDTYAVWNRLITKDAGFPIILAMIVQSNEVNYFEQMQIIEGLQNRGIEACRLTLSEIGASGYLTKDRHLIYEG